MPARPLLPGLLAAGLALFAGRAGLMGHATAAAPTPQTPWTVQLVDVAREAGLVVPSVYGGLERKRFIIETNGAGVALLDYDDDGWLDALVLSGTRLQEGARADVQWPRGEAPSNRLYRNQRDGTFADVTDRAGLTRTGWASSVCAGDYDNDGRIDLFLTSYGRNALYRNRGGRFEDATAAAGLETEGVRWGSGCSFVDYDRDGRLDLFVANYLRFDLAGAAEPGQGANCVWKGVPVNCGPKGLPFDTNLLYRNAGDGRFVDVSEKSGIAKVTSRYPMTAVAADLDADGWVDLYAACDSTPSILFRNNRDGTFTDTAVESGLAYGEFGNAQAGMGLALGDFDRDGQLDVLKTHFADDVPALYRALGRGLYEDAATATGLGALNRYVEWGAGLPDYDNDGDVDVLVMNMNEPPSLLRNDYAGANGWLAVKLAGTRSNRLGLGATVRVTVGGRTTARAVLSQTSYYSHDDLRLHFGLGPARRADAVEVTWPSGQVDCVRDVEGGRVFTIREGESPAPPGSPAPPAPSAQR